MGVPASVLTWSMALLPGVFYSTVTQLQNLTRDCDYDGSFGWLPVQRQVVDNTS